jgi:phosphoserine phosphatase RsbU/P
VREQIIKQNVDYKSVEINSLQEIALAINSNLPEESLYKIFYFTLKANLNVNKFVVYSLDDQDWKCTLQYGVKSDFKEKGLPNDVLQSNSILYFFKYTHEHESFSEFDIAIPVSYKNKVISYIFLGWPDDSQIFFPNIVPFLRTVSNIIVVAIENKKMAKNEIEREKMKKELEIARTVQSHLFPKKLPNNERVQMAATYLPHQSVGGDYYDFIPVDENKFYICIGDVSGKGIPAALTMSNFQASLHTMIRMGLDLQKIIQELNYQLYENTQNGTFITFFIALVDMKEQLLHYVNAGHNTPFLLLSDGNGWELETGTTILGPIKNLPFVNEGVMKLPLGSTLFLYTDGLIETENPSLVQFGTTLVVEELRKHKNLTPSEINKLMVYKLDEFRKGNPYADDITLLTCKIS